MRVLLTGAALLLARAGLITESRGRGQQSDRREQHDETLTAFIDSPPLNQERGWTNNRTVRTVSYVQARSTEPTPEWPPGTVRVRGGAPTSSRC
jgi:hypothetical protein